MKVLVNGARRAFSKNLKRTVDRGTLRNAVLYDTVSFDGSASNSVSSTPSKPYDQQQRSACAVRRTRFSLLHPLATFLSQGREFHGTRAVLLQ